MSNHVFSIMGRQLKLDSRTDIEPLLSEIDPDLTEEIHFGGNTIGVEAAEALGQTLRKMKKLKVADFADIFTGRLISEIPAALTHICDALVDVTSLEELNLNDNAFGGRSVAPLVPLLSKNRSIRTLKLENNGLGPEGGRIVANALLKCATSCARDGLQSSLRTVICGRNRLENGSASAWAEAFAAHGNLEEVRMMQNGIRQEGFTAIVNGLAKNPSLRHLCLSDNLGRDLEEDEDASEESESENGWHALSAALPGWKELRFLDISDCGVNTPGLNLLMAALRSGLHKNLHTLLLVNDDLQGSSYAELHQLVTDRLPGLKKLNLSVNDDLEDESLIALADTLERRGGRLILEEDEDEDFIIAVPDDTTATSVSADVDELADLVASMAVRKS